jgi:hypothetical protein
MMIVEMGLLGLLDLLVKAFQKSPTNRHVTFYPSILIAYLSAHLGHIKVAPFEPSICM